MTTNDEIKLKHLLNSVYCVNPIIKPFTLYSEDEEYKEKVRDLYKHKGVTP